MDDKKPTNRNRSKDSYVSQDTTDYDGVRYTPSHRRSEPAPRREIPERQQTQTGAARKKLPAKKQKSQFAIFFITTVFVGVIICVIVFAVVFSSIIGNRNDDPSALLPSPKASASEKAPESISGKSVIAIITKIQSSNKTISLYDLEENKSYSVTVDGTTALKDKYGNSMVLAEYKEGEIVDAVFGDTDNLLKSMQSSTQSWKLVSNAKVDTAAKTISISNATYKYTNDIITVYNGESFDLSTLTPIDVVTVKGYKDTAWYVSLDKSHGVLKVEERPDIISGTIEIDTTIFESLDEPKEINVTEGSHHIVVKGSNIEPFSKEIIVETGETYILDLSEIKLKAGAMTFNINEPDAKLTVNGEEKNPKEPLVLDYGEYEIKVTKEGFGDWSQNIKFDTPNYNVDIKLEKIVQVSKVSIATSPEGAHIYIDNIYVGLSPIDSSVEYGLKTITVKKDGYLEISFPVNIITDNVQLPTITLQEKQENVPTDIPPASAAVKTPPPATAQIDTTE